MMKIASYSRESLNGKLWKSRSRYAEIKHDLFESPSDKELLESKAGLDTQRLQRELRRCMKEKEELAREVEEATLEADRREVAVSHAAASWDLMQIRASSKGGRGSSFSDLEHELQSIEKLYKLLQAKGNLYQGLGTESLRGDAQIHLQKLLKHAVLLIQDRHSQIRAGAPRFSFHIDPKIYDQETFNANGSHEGRRTTRGAQRMRVARAKAS
ncbi:uncharacterized protein LOC112343409 [Selaginella moellendorffii]|uniref:uncharacterized protein LOC112343409 n=1 Tax=Selaginella moellendorffii TaxID=88036 RepID=UPI000D1C5CA5|nr:uncharacterized protein LOC112343409 [Selaginella moellendorffii]|eukprot:XP_024522571.1 uncharacterized protein LOC112343409 [Selaginella moellendorffii]